MRLWLKKTRGIRFAGVSLAAALLLVLPVVAQDPPAVSTEERTADTPEGGCGGGCPGCGRMGGQGRGPGPHGPRAGGGPGGEGCARDGHPQVIHGLLERHESVRREVREIEGGVSTTTTSEDPVVTEQIRVHVRQMQARMQSGDGLRHWDPLFVELFTHHEAVKMEINDVPGGVEVRETSADPQVVLLIREHARTVSGFVEDGFERAHRESPLPEGYRSAAGEAEAGPGSQPAR